MKEKEKVLARVQERIDRGEVVAGGFTGNDIAGKGKVEGEKLQTGSGRSLRWVTGCEVAGQRRVGILLVQRCLLAGPCSGPRCVNHRRHRIGRTSPENGVKHDYSCQSLSWLQTTTAGTLGIDKGANGKVSKQGEPKAR